MMRPESFSEKLYIPRNVDGEPNHEWLDHLRELEKQLESHESFIGLAPWGSVFSGYSNPKSDLDVFVLYDSSKESEAEIVEPIKQIVRELDAAKGIETHFQLRDINPELIAEELRKEADVETDAPDQLSALTRVVTGDRVNQYRGEISAVIHELAPEAQRSIADDIVYNLGFYDAQSLNKRKERFPGLSDDDQKKILNDRLGMWASRVERILGIAPDMEKISKFEYITDPSH